ncbi:MFS transporter [Paenibacillus sp. sgz500958]|uniref:MFS transporter n=1 Tax=Paenibacillus sp. sgz500958 TaxID=3242475 RepID=UPI0036D29D76
MNQFITLLKNKTYSRLLFASFVSEMGTMIGVTAFIVYLLRSFADRPFLTTLSELMSTLPILLVFAFVGVITDRFNRQKLAVYSLFFSAGVSVLLMIAVLTKSLPFIFACLFIRTSVHFFFNPAQASLVQGVLSKKDYVVASGLNQMLKSSLDLFGKSLGVFMFWSLGITGAILIDTVSFLLAGLLIHSCKFDRNLLLPNGESGWSKLQLSSISRDYKEGLTYALGHKVIRILLSGCLVFGVLNAFFALLPIFLLKYKLAPANYETIVMYEGFAVGLGIILGSYVVAIAAKKLKPFQMIILGLFTTGASTVLIAFSHQVTTFLVCMFAIAFFLPLINVGIGGWLPALVEPQKMGRVGGLMTPLIIMSQVLSLLILYLIFPAKVSVSSLFLFLGLMLIGFSILYSYLFPRAMKPLQESKPPLAEVTVN